MVFYCEQATGVEPQVRTDDEATPGRPDVPGMFEQALTTLGGPQRELSRAGWCRRRFWQNVGWGGGGVRSVDAGEHQENPSPPAARSGPSSARGDQEIRPELAARRRGWAGAVTTTFAEIARPLRTGPGQAHVGGIHITPSGKMQIAAHRTHLRA